MNETEKVELFTTMHRMNNKLNELLFYYTQMKKFVYYGSLVIIMAAMLFLAASCIRLYLI